MELGVIIGSLLVLIHLLQIFYVHSLVLLTTQLTDRKTQFLNNYYKRLNRVFKKFELNGNKNCPAISCFCVCRSAVGNPCDFFDSIQTQEQLNERIWANVAGEF